MTATTQPYRTPLNTLYNINRAWLRGEISTAEHDRLAAAMPDPAPWQLAGYRSPEEYAYALAEIEMDRAARLQAVAEYERWQAEALAADAAAAAAIPDGPQEG